MATYIDINATTFLKTEDGQCWRLYRDGTETVIFWGDEAYAKRRAKRRPTAGEREEMAAAAPFDRVAYQREYMRKRRAALKA